MAKDDENAGNADKRTLSSEKNKFEKERKRARLEGMIAYQKHLIEQLRKENATLTEQLNAL